MLQFLYMQTNPPKEPQPPIRQRPLQKSMFLPDHYPPQNFIHPAPQQNHTEFQQYNPMRRSLLQNTAIGPTSPQYQFRTQNNQSFTANSYQQNSTLNGQFITVEQRQASPHQLLHHSTSLTNMKQASIVLDRGLEGNNDSIVKNIARFEKQPTTQIKTITKPMFETGQPQKLVTEIVNLIKEKHLPTLVSVVKKELQEEIHAFKQQFSQFKQEFKHHVGKQEAINNQLRNTLNHPSTATNGRQKSPAKKNKEKENDISQLQKELFLLQGRFNKLQGTTNENFNFFGQQLDKICQRLQEKLKKQEKNLFRISNIKSTLSAVMLEYKQLFSVKKPTNEQQKRVSNQQIILSVCQYYVDRQGFLMDNQNHYLVDHKGNQIRLEQKHIKLLQHHKILHR